MPVRELPQLQQLFLTDGGLETDLIFNQGVDLPCFASIVLLRDATGTKRLTDYYRRYFDIARQARTGFILESATWRASADWAAPLGLTLDELDELNRRAVAVLLELRAEWADAGLPIVVSGCHGPRGDGYDPGHVMTAAQARAYHARQATALVDAGADMLSAMTMTNTPEAIGVTEAARDAGAPVAVSFTLETDGRLPTGETLADAIRAVEDATGGYPAYYMVNCAHTSHYEAVLDNGAEWTRRVRGLRSNASRSSHAELNVMTTLDEGDPAEFGRDHARLRAANPSLTVLGGCCGTDHRHVAAIAASLKE
jgi:homocysteine S-methyltransferase